MLPIADRGKECLQDSDGKSATAAAAEMAEPLEVEVDDGGLPAAYPVEADEGALVLEKTARSRGRNLVLAPFILTRP